MELRFPGYISLRVCVARISVWNTSSWKYPRQTSPCAICSGNHGDDDGEAWAANVGHGLLMELEWAYVRGEDHSRCPQITLLGVDSVIHQSEDNCGRFVCECPATSIEEPVSLNSLLFLPSHHHIITSSHHLYTSSVLSKPCSQWRLLHTPPCFFHPFMMPWWPPYPQNSKLQSPSTSTTIWHSQGHIMHQLPRSRFWTSAQAPAAYLDPLPWPGQQQGGVKIPRLCGSLVWTIARKCWRLHLRHGLLFLAWMWNGNLGPWEGEGSWMAWSNWIWRSSLQDLGTILRLAKSRSWRWRRSRRLCEWVAFWSWTSSLSKRFWTRMLAVEGQMCGTWKMGSGNRWHFWMTYISEHDMKQNDITYTWWSFEWRNCQQYA